MRGVGFIDTIILDLDGPILDGRYRHFQCYKNILEENGFCPMKIEKYWKMKRNRLSRIEQLSESGAEAFYDRFLSEWIERIEDKKYLKYDLIQPGCPTIFSEWADLGFTLVLSTHRKRRSNLLWQLEEFGLVQCFDEIVSVAAPSSKEKAERTVRKLAKFDPELTVWVGDTEVDVEAAKYLGIKICAVTCGLRSAEYLESLKPDYLEKDLGAFASRLKPKPNL
jgi:phosphoglycolate phosphatase-like HAD superfamily hydrolase